MTLRPMARLIGAGVVTTNNPSPRGVVNLGPESKGMQSGPDIELNSVSGITIQGPGLSWSWPYPNTSHPSVNQSVALNLDSTEQFGGDGCCYQNTVHDISIYDVDVGVHMGADVNANTLTNIQMMSIGRIGCEWRQCPASILCAVDIVTRRKTPVQKPCLLPCSTLLTLR